MKYLEEMLGLAEREFKEMVDRGKFRSPDEVHTAYELMDIVKDAFCIWQYEGEMNGYSETTYPYSGYPSSYENSYARGRGYSRGMGMPRYSMESDRPMNYSRTDAKEDFIHDLNRIIVKSPDEEVQHKIQNLIQYVERM